ncbi:MAG: helix-turn-helix domain-containing protein [Cardiobacteriaceae bacterium]|nr:helix-turn-helix domain-containing protein [Cardiobacteriaceae bacterium]
MTNKLDGDRNTLTQLLVFGSKLEIARKKIGLTQKELAERCGTSQRVQSGYERGIVAPKLDYLFKLAQQGIDIRSLLFDDHNLYTLDSREQTVIELYRQATIEVQLQTLEVLASQAARRDGTNSNSALIAGSQSITIIKKKRNQ